MTEYLSEVINPDKPGSFMKDTKEKIEKREREKMALVKKYINSIVILEHKTVLIQKISNRNPINENMALNHNFDLMYIEEDYNDITNLEWKLVMQPRVQKIETIINKINNNGR